MSAPSLKVEQATTTVTLATAAPVAPAPPWTPQDIAGLTVWLDASDVGAITTQWPDKSGQNRHGNIVGSPPPAVGLRTKNGLPLVSFKINEGRVRGNHGLTFDYTVVYVAQRIADIGRIYTSAYPPPNFLVGTHVSGDDCAYDNGWIKSGVYLASPAPWRMYGADGKSAGGYQCRFFIDGVVSGTVSAGGGMGNTYNLSGYDATGGQETTTADVAEVLIYNRRLPDDERIAVEDYLRQKWGL